MEGVFVHRLAIQDKESEVHHGMAWNIEKPNIKKSTFSNGEMNASN